MSVYLNIFERGGKIYERYIDENLDEQRRIVDDFKPSLFIANPNTESKYKTIFGVSCVKKTFDSIKLANQSARNSPMPLLGQEDCASQYISDNYPGVINLVKYNNLVRVANIDIEVPAPQFPSPNQSDHEITSIAHYDSILDKHTVFVVATKSQKWLSKYSILPQALLDKVEVIEYATEKEMLGRYLLFWRENFPVIVTGYNTDGFDIPYLYNRYEKVFSKKVADKLSPWGLVKRKLVIQWPPGKEKTEALENELKEKNKYFYDVKLYGIESLDWLALYKNFSFTPQPSYKLDAIGESEIGQQKIHFRHNFMEVYGKSEIKQSQIFEDSHPYEYYAYLKHLCKERMTLGASPMSRKFIEIAEGDLLDTKRLMSDFKELQDCDISQELIDWLDEKAIQLAFQMVTDYNVMDVELVNKLDQHRGFINLSKSLAYYAKINFQTVFSPINTWDSIIFNSLRVDHKVIPKRVGGRKEAYIGGHVKEPIRGLKKMIASFDLESLYPSIIRQLNISPETFVMKQDFNGEIVEAIEAIVAEQPIYDTSEYSLSANGCSYEKSFVGTIPLEINKVFMERKEFKKLMFVHDKNVQHIKEVLKSRT